jgi:hypothetical protein
MQHNHHLNKPLSGVPGYKRLVRLVVRAFYSGECPPPDAEEEQAAVRKRGDKVGLLRLVPVPEAAHAGRPPAEANLAQHCACSTASRAWAYCWWTCWRARTAM